MPDDPLAGTAGVTTVADRQALTAALFAEVQRTYEPIVQGFRARRQTSIANAWASVVDGLLQGFLLAGRAEIGLDAAWDLWQTTISTWDVPTRRWPRRLPFAEDGLKDEVVVRAACCLICTSADADGAEAHALPELPDQHRRRGPHPLDGGLAEAACRSTSRPAAHPDYGIRGLYPPVAVASIGNYHLHQRLAATTAWVMRRTFVATSSRVRAGGQPG